MEIKRLSSLFFLLSSFPILLPASQAANPLAKVNGSVITLEDFNSKYQENLKYFHYRIPTKQSVLDELIKRELGIQEAKRQGLHKDPEVIDRMNSVLYQVLLERQLGKEFEKIHISSKEAKAFYDKNPEIRTSHIFVGLAPGASKKEISSAYNRIKEIRDKYLRPGKMGFAEVAQRFSEGMAAPMGGDLDYQTKDKLDPKYYTTAIRLKPGNYSGIIRTQFGFHIVKLTAVRPWHKTDQARIKRIVFEERKKELFERYMKRLRQKAKVTVNSSLIR